MKHFLLTSLLALAPLTSRAQLVQSFSGGDPLSVGPGVAGWEFQVGSQPLTLAAFGVFDEFSDGVLSSAHSVGLWNAVTGTLLAKITVAPATATLSSGYFYANLISPIELTQGTRYRLGAQYSDVDLDLARGNVPAGGVVTDSRITLRDAYLSSGSGFEFPDLNVSGANLGFFGPNASFIPVPEPAAAAFAAGILLAAFAAVRRKLIGPAALFAFTALSLSASQPRITIRDVLDAKASNRDRIAAGYLAQNPGKSKTIKAAVPPANRPPVTPGNEHGNRPEIPPGIENYATP